MCQCARSPTSIGGQLNFVIMDVKTRQHLNGKEKEKKVSGVRAYCLFDCMKERGEKSPSAAVPLVLVLLWHAFFFRVCMCICVLVSESVRWPCISPHRFSMCYFFFFFADQQMLRRKKKSNSLFIFSSSSLSDQFALSWLCLVN